MDANSASHPVERIARIAVLLALCLAVAGQASARQSPAGPSTDPAVGADCLSVSPTSRVVVDTSAGQALRGTLMCLSETGAWLVQDGRLLKMPLDDIKRIRTTADPVWDGAVKGAVIPLIMWAVLCHECSAEPWLKLSLTYGLVGLTIDALDTNRKTLYEGRGRSLSVGWSFSF